MYAHWKEDNRTKNEVSVNANFVNFVSATLDGSELNIKVNKNCISPNTIKYGEIFEWGIRISESLDGYGIGDNVIEITITTNDDYSVRYSSIELLSVTGENKYYREKVLSNRIETTFGGQYFHIGCDIANEYIATENICINSIYCSSQ